MNRVGFNPVLAARFSGQNPFKAPLVEKRPAAPASKPAKRKTLKWLAALGAGLMALLPLGCAKSDGSGTYSSPGTSYSQPSDTTGGIGISTSGNPALKLGPGIGIDLSTGQVTPTF